MNTNEVKIKRPIAITIICVIMLIGFLLIIPMLLSHRATAIGPWYPPYLGFSGIIGLVCMVGFWFMKKWAAYVYIAFVVINQLVLLVGGWWTPMALIVPLVVVIVLLYNISKMT